MAAELQGQGQLRNQLAATVRQMNWSYAIFWSTSPRQQGTLVWSDGYYNGDIKTRRTVQPTEFEDDQLGLQRSNQLRELYESLADGEGNQQLQRRPSASLSPEDLTNTEWYYLVCMSFTFAPGQCLPGKALMSNKHIWVNDARLADKNFFTRYLLAKVAHVARPWSAAIQTVACFPFTNGVFEFGTTDSVLEGTELIQKLYSDLWRISDMVYPEQSTSTASLAENDHNTLCQNIDRSISGTSAMDNHNLVVDFHTMLEPSFPDFPFPAYSYASKARKEYVLDEFDDLDAKLYEESTGSPGAGSNECSPNMNTDPFSYGGFKNPSKFQTRLIGNGFSSCLNGSLISSDYICKSVIDCKNASSSPTGEKSSKETLPGSLLEVNYSQCSSMDLDSDESHYKKTLATILRNSQGLAQTHLLKISNESSFTVWRRDLIMVKPLGNTSQNMLKKTLLNVARMRGHHSNPQEEYLQQDKVRIHEVDYTSTSHVLSERRRREKLNEKFLALRSLIPSISKVHKASILSDAIEYIKELQRKVEELEPSRDSFDMRSRHVDIVERTSDNRREKGTAKSMARPTNKRKERDTDDQRNVFLAKDGQARINVTIADNEALVEMQCPWRECMIADVFRSTNGLHLDPFLIQSSTEDAILTLTMKSKLRSLAVTQVMIRRALQDVIDEKLKN